MKKPLLLLLLLASLLPTSAQTGAWKAYMAYSAIQQIVKGGNTLYVRASNDLYTYNLADHSITTYDKVNALSDCNIAHIAWSQQVKRLIVVYQNANIDFIDQQGNVVNLSSFYAKSMTQDKTVNRIDVVDQYAYLATGFGIVKVNMQRCEIAESYILNQNILATGHDQLYLYAQRADGQVLRGLLEQNLIDPHNWEATTAVPQGIFDQDLTDYNQYLATVETLQPGGPKYNDCAFLRVVDGKLYSAGGRIVWGTPTTVQLWDGHDWTICDEDVTKLSDRQAFHIIYSVDVDPLDPSHIAAGTTIGLVEFRDAKITAIYNQDNSPVESALNPKNFTLNEQKNYNLITSVKFDQQGNLWAFNSQAPTQALLLLPHGSQQLQSVSAPKLMNFSDQGVSNKSMPWMMDAFFSDDGLLWFYNDYWTYPSLHRLRPSASGVTDYLALDYLVNQDGIHPAIVNIAAMDEDLDGNIWIGTEQGLYMFTPEQQQDSSQGFTQIKIPRNDGTNYADYLMAGANVSAIAVDGGNRKWIATHGSGLYLISADNMEQLLNFTTQNSPLLSDNILSLAWDEQSGQLYIGTDAGLCGYYTDASVAAVEMVKDNVYAYPNPVVSGYSGLITVRGLTRDADVKILTTSGQLVYQGRSNGGTFTWNGCDTQGRRVASGIYMVCTATSAGESGVVCKIAFIK